MRRTNVRRLFPTLAALMVLATLTVFSPCQPAALTPDAPFPPTPPTSGPTSGPTPAPSPIRPSTTATQHPPTFPTPTSAAPPSPTQAPARTKSPTPLPAPTPTPAPSTSRTTATPGPTPPPQVVKAARHAAALHLGLPRHLSEDRLSLHHWQDTVWIDGSMGCARPGQVYTKALIPGFILTFSHPQGSISVHTDNSRGQSIIPVGCTHHPRNKHP